MGNLASNSPPKTKQITTKLFNHKIKSFPQLETLQYGNPTPK
jgi:hypothetical protein